jgi:DNA-binding SARP family transcriptional activator
MVRQLAGVGGQPLVGWPKGETVHLDQVEIRLLGPFIVRRADGSVVASSDWRTQRAVELLRLLALTPDESVDAEALAGQLWPDVPESKARASLRTATYHLRRVLGDEHVERRGAGLALVGVWVDVQAYATKAAEVDAAHRAHEHAATVALAREAEALYVDDLDVREAPPALVEEAARLVRLRGTVLLQGAEAAARLGWMRDALELAQPAHAADPHSERAARVLMRALAGLGEVQEALAVFERQSHELRHALGVDPSPQTRALHLQVLTGMSPVSAADDAAPGPVADVMLVLQDILDAPSGGGVVLIEGTPRSGRSLVAGQACARMRLDLRHARSDSLDLADRSTPFAGLPPQDSVLCLPAAGHMTPANLAWYVRIARERQTVLVVPVDRLDEEVRSVQRSGGTPVRVVGVPRLDRTSLAATAADVLQGRPSRDLVEWLMSETDGMAGLVIERLRSLLTDGLVVWTPEGLTIRSHGPRDRLVLAPLLQRLIRALSSQALDVLAVVGVVGVPVTVEEVERVLSRSLPESHGTLWVAAALDWLVDRGLLDVSPLGYRLRNEDHRDQIVGWLRPASALRLHRAVAEELDITPLERARHLVVGGRHQAAAELGAVELRRAGERGDWEAERAWIELLDRLPGRMRVGPGRHRLSSRVHGFAQGVNRIVGAAVCATVVWRSWLHAEWSLPVESLITPM